MGMQTSPEINSNIRRYQARTQNLLTNSNRINQLLDNNDIQPTIENESNNLNMDINLEMDENGTNEQIINNTLSSPPPLPIIRDLNKAFNISVINPTLEQKLQFINNISRLDLMEIIETNKMETEQNAFYCGYLNDESKPCGYGILINKKNDSIKGFFEDGLKCVKNSISNISNIKYESDIIDGIPNGNGRIDFLNGSVYNGNITNGFQNGKGRMVYCDRTIYDGDWVMGMREGIGEYIEGDGHYKGGWKDNNKHGKGELNINGTVLNGNWYMDRKHGEFTETSSNGSCFISKYDNDVLVCRGANTNGEILELKQKL